MSFGIVVAIPMAMGFLRVVPRRWASVRLKARELGRWVGAAVAVALTVAAPAARAARGQDRPTTDGRWMVRTWESEDGLPENSATAMVQTSDHYLWFGTFNGLVRFDGVRFAVFDPVNTPGLPSSGIVNLHLDRAARLWVSTFRGLVWRDGSKWERPPGATPPVDDFIRSFVERANGDLLLTTFAGRLFEFVDGALRPLPSPPGIPGQGYLGGSDEEGRWWVAQEGFVGRWLGMAWERTVPEAEMPSGARGYLACAAAREGGLWVLLRSEVRRYAGGGVVARRSLPEMRTAVWSLFEDSAGDIWVSTIDRGVLQLAADGRVQWWNEETGLSYHGARFVFEDEERNLWIGTSGGGLVRFKPRRVTTFGPEQGLTERVVKTVWPTADGGMWLGTYGGGLFRLGDQGIRPWSLADSERRRRYVQSVLTDRQGRTWAGMFVDGLYRFDGHGGESIAAELTGGNNVIALFEDSRGRIWLSGGHGVAVFEAGGFRPVSPASGAPTQNVQAIGEQADGTIWLSNTERVFRQDGARWDEVHAPEGGPAREIACFHGEADGSMWMGSMADGLIRWRAGQATRITKTNGLPARGVYSILADEPGYFWMASSRGIVRADRHVLDAVADGIQPYFSGQLLDRSDGLDSAECPGGQQPTAARDARGRLWFATLKGVAMVDPAAFRTNAVAPPAIVEDFTYYRVRTREAPGIPVEQRVSAPFLEPVALPAGSHHLVIRYTAPSFVSPEKARFRYRLEGADGVWRDGNDLREAHFENLKPGHYRFQVRAANDDGFWGREIGELAFVVHPRFWQTGLFRGGAAMAIVGAVGAWMYRMRVRLVGKHAAQVGLTRQLIASQEAERSRLARELHDDLTQRLARLAIDAGQVERTVVPPARDAIVQLREGLVRLSEDVHALSYRLHPSILEDLGLAEALKAEAERFSRQTQMEVAVKVSGVPDTIPKDAALCLFRVAEEGLQNVLRHARARTVEVSLRGYDAGLQLAVQDDGVGFLPAKVRARPSLGLAGMRERVDLLGGHLDIESAPGQGTSIVAWLPLMDVRS